jgi:type IV secretory pathway VirB2 component (pilin)
MLENLLQKVTKTSFYLTVFLTCFFLISIFASILSISIENQNNSNSNVLTNQIVKSIDSINFLKINVKAEEGSIFRLDILGTRCLFPGQPNCDGKNNLVDQIRNFLFGLGNATAVVVIMYGGFKFFFSGMVDGIEDGKTAITNGIIGLVLINSAGFLAGLITGGQGGNGIINQNGLNSAPLEGFLSTVANDFLLPLSTVVAVLVIIYGGYQYMFSPIAEDKADGIETIKKGAIGLVVVLIAAPIIGLINNTISSQGAEELQLNANPIANFVVGTILSKLVIPIATVISIFFVVFGGYQMITSRGDSNKYEEGVTSLKNSVIGLIVVLLSTTIVALVALFADI